MKRWSTACLDWEERIVAGRSLIPFEPLFPAEAEAALDIFRHLKIVDAHGSPEMQQACRQWVFDFVAAVFGAYDAESGRRLIRYFFLLISKKNSKSTIAAGIMLTALLLNWRLDAEYYIIAPTIEVAQNSFQPALSMIRASDELAALLHTQAHLRTITHRTTGATLKVIAADSQTVSGKKTVGLLIEELWEFGKQANAENMLREATGGLASRPEGFVIYLTTQSDEPPVGVFKQQLQEFRDIRDGKVADPRSLGVLYEFPEALIKAKAYEKREFWHITNPNLGASVDEEFLADQFAKDSRKGQASLNGFFAKHLNVEIGQTLRADNWPGARYWEKQARAPFSLAELIEDSDVVTAGVDGGGLDDMLGFCALGRDIENPKQWRAFFHAWIHEGVLDLRKSEATRFRDLERAGDLTIVKTMREAFVQLADRIEEISHAGKLAVVGVDPAGVGEIVDELAGRGINEDGGQVIGVPQGYRLNGVIKSTEGRLSDGLLIHGGQSLMAWCVGNAKVEQKGNAVLITKQASGVGKIDPVMALLDAVTPMLDQPEVTNGPSIYNSAEARPVGFLVV